MDAERLLDALMKAPALERLRFLRVVKAQGPDLRADAVAELEARGWTRYRIAQELGISRQAVNQWRR
jgi:transposase-like protein